jgi:hypothetical protein
MKPLDLDFAEPGFRDSLLSPHLLLSCVFFMTICYSAWQFWEARHAVLDYRESIVHQADVANQKERAAAAKPVVLSSTQVLAINAEVDRLNIPWRDLLDALDQMTPASITLLEVEPNPVTRKILIQAECHTAEEMTSYIKSLENSPYFSTAILTRHEIDTGSTERELKFSADIPWRNVRSEGIAR